MNPRYAGTRVHLMQGRNQYLVCKVGKTAVLSRFRSQSKGGGGADYAQSLNLPHLNLFRDYAPMMLA